MIHFSWQCKLALRFCRFVKAHLAWYLVSSALSGILSAIQSCGAFARLAADIVALNVFLCATAGTGELHAALLGFHTVKGALQTLAKPMAAGRVPLIFGIDDTIACVFNPQTLTEAHDGAVGRIRGQFPG